MNFLRRLLSSGFLQFSSLLSRHRFSCLAGDLFDRKVSCIRFNDAAIFQHDGVEAVERVGGNGINNFRGGVGSGLRFSGRRYFPRMHDEEQACC